MVNNFSGKAQIGVLGGGITGLSAAFWLSELFPDAQITLLEAENRMGGVIGSKIVDGNLLETGPLAFPASSPATGELLDKARLGNTSANISANSNQLTYSRKSNALAIWNGHKLISLPNSPGAFLRSGLLSLKGGLRLVAEPIIPKLKWDGDESIRQFFLRRTGLEFLENYIEPIFAGVLSGDPEKMSMMANLPSYYLMEKESGSLGLGLLKKRILEWNLFNPSKPNEKKCVSTHEGAGGIIQALTEELRRRHVDLLYSQRISSIEKNKQYRIQTTGYRSVGERIFDSIICCIPSHGLAALVPNWPKAILNIISDIPHAPLLLAHLTYTKYALPQRFAGEGFLMQSRAKEDILSAFFPLRLFPKQGPENLEGVRVLLGGARHPEFALLKDTILNAMAQAAMRKIMQVDEQPRFLPLIRHSHGLPQLQVGHVKSLAKVRQWLQINMPGFYLAGTSYHGAGIESAVASGKSAAIEVAQFMAMHGGERSLV